MSLTELDELAADRLYGPDAGSESDLRMAARGAPLAVFEPAQGRGPRCDRLIRRVRDGGLARHYTTTERRRVCRG